MEVQGQGPKLSDEAMKHLEAKTLFRQCIGIMLVWFGRLSLSFVPVICFVAFFIVYSLRNLTMYYYQLKKAKVEKDEEEK